MARGVRTHGTHAVGWGVGVLAGLGAGIVAAAATAATSLLGDGFRPLFRRPGPVLRPVSSGGSSTRG